MQKLRDILQFLMLIILGLLVLVISAPFFLLISPYAFFRNKIEDKRLEGYIKTLDGKSFFCYNNRKNSLPFIEANLIPALSPEVETIFLNGRTIENEKYEEAFLSRIFYQFQHYNKFPHLLKFRDGKAVDKSINASFYRVLNQDKELDSLLGEMDEFFAFNGSIES